MKELKLLNDLDGLEPNDKLSFILDTIQKFPSFYFFKIKLAQIKLASNLLDQAKELLSQVPNVAPYELSALLLQASINLKKNNPEQAHKVYSGLIDKYPENHWAYMGNARILFNEGEIDTALNLLEKGIKMSKKPLDLIVRRTEFLLKIGEYDLALEELGKYIDQRGSEPDILLVLARTNMRKGNFNKAVSILTELKESSDNNSKWFIKANELLANIAFLQFDYELAKRLILEVVQVSGIKNFLRNRLALISLLEGKVYAALEELKLATREIQLEKTKGSLLVPLIGHASRVINEFNINPKLCLEVQKSILLSGNDRLRFLAKIQFENPNYFGSALYLINALRSQGIFHLLKKTSIPNSNPSQIPKTIVQYWDANVPPPAIQRIMKTWKDKNPNYEHKVFSRKTAYFFLKYNCSIQEANAFNSCKHPALQADFFRLAYLSKMGGFYADADDKCVSSLDALAEKDFDLVLKLGDFGCISNNFIGSTPNNELLSLAYKKGLENVNSYFLEGPWFKLGPGHLTNCVTHYLSQFILDDKLDLVPRTLVLGQAESRKYLYQHLSLPYKTGDDSWYSAEYKRNITKQ